MDTNNYVYLSVSNIILGRVYIIEMTDEYLYVCVLWKSSSRVNNVNI